MQQYTPGLHILSSFQAEQHDLCAMHECREYLNSLIGRLGLTKVGEAWHLFENGGFTAVIALTESHVSLHTWPEYGMATFDVFLSNYRRDNADRARSFYRDTISFFKGRELDCRELTR